MRNRRKQPIFDSAADQLNYRRRHPWDCRVLDFNGSGVIGSWENHWNQYDAYLKLHIAKDKQITGWREVLELRLQLEKKLPKALALEQNKALDKQTAIKRDLLESKQKSEALELKIKQF